MLPIFLLRQFLPVENPAEDSGRRLQQTESAGDGQVKAPFIKPKKGRRTSVEAMPDLDDDDDDGDDFVATTESSAAGLPVAVRGRHGTEWRKESGIKLEDLEHIGTLGVGTFARVKLVKVRGSEETYALKIMKKKVIEARKQKEHVMNEKNIMVNLTHKIALPNVPGAVDDLGAL